MLLRLRLCAIVSLIAILAAIAGYIALEVHTFNAYCMEERRDVIRSGLTDPEIWKLAVTWLFPTALPCLIAQRRQSLVLLIGIAGCFATICIASLPIAFGPPLECFTSGGSYPGDLFDIAAPMTCVLMSVVFYVILIFDFIAARREGPIATTGDHANGSREAKP